MACNVDHSVEALGLLGQILANTGQQIDLPEFIGELDIRNLEEDTDDWPVRTNKGLKTLVENPLNEELCVFEWRRMDRGPFTRNFSIDVARHGDLINGLRYEIVDNDTGLVLGVHPINARLLVRNHDEQESEYILTELGGGDTEWDFSCIPLITLQRGVIVLEILFECEVVNGSVRVYGHYGYLQCMRRQRLATGTVSDGTWKYENGYLHEQL